MIVEFTEKEIQDKIKQIADIINQKQYDKPPVFICVLNGAFMFFTDLVKRISKENPELKGAELFKYASKVYRGKSKSRSKSRSRKSRSRSRRRHH